MTYTRCSSIFKYTYRYTKTIAFAKKCVELCWLMAVQDPPLVFGPFPHQRDKFNADLYREYTRSGTMVDFTVWPVLHLYENGPVLSKGVVEPIKEGWTDNRAESRSYGAHDQGQFFETNVRQHHRDLAVDESSRPVSALDTRAYEREVDNLFKSDRYRGGGYSGRSATEPYDVTSVGTRHTSRVDYQQDILPTSHHRQTQERYLNRHSGRQYSSGSHRSPWRF